MLDAVKATIEVFHHKTSLKFSDMHGQVGAFTLKVRVRSLLYYEKLVARCMVGELVGLSSELEGMFVWCAALDGHLDNVTLLDYSVAVAGVALVQQDLGHASSVACIADLPLL